MSLAAAIASFLGSIKIDGSAPPSSVQLRALERCAHLLLDCSSEFSMNDLTANSLRELLVRCYVEKAFSQAPDTSDDHSAAPRGTSSSAGLNSLPTASELLSFVAVFLKFVDSRNRTRLSSDCAPMLEELSETLPRAVELTRLLANSIRERRGAFSFPEFLTSFEEGGRSEYDVDVPSGDRAREGYFRIIRVEGELVEAEDLIRDDRVWPIVFPADVAAKLDREYILNLELVRSGEGWQITDCGFVYPPDWRPTTDDRRRMTDDG